ncbi:MAG: homocysteine biosynthesis protein [Christensenellales bacterium]|jgi:uncharacterized protein (DUF39 family)
MEKTFDEINERIQSKRAVVMTAEEVVALVKEEGVSSAAKKVDVVTCATFGAMCSSGAFLNFGHADPPIRMGKIFLNNVPCSGGLAAVDTYIGVTEPSLDNGITYGGAHVIEDLITGKSVYLHAESSGTDCYPRKSIDTLLTLDDMNQAYLYNPRNAYQNYSAAINMTNSIIHTYMGTLLPNMGNVTYSTSGEMSPLLKDPKLRTIGVGTRIFLGGADGMVAWEGTQFKRNVVKVNDGMEYSGATIAVIGDMKEMNPRYIRGATIQGYGCTLYVGIGIPIPVLDEDLMYDLSRPNDEIYTTLTDYSTGTRERSSLGKYNYAQLRSGTITFKGKNIRTAPLSSLFMAREIALLLKDKIKGGSFILQKPIRSFPAQQIIKPITMREVSK